MRKRSGILENVYIGWERRVSREGIRIEMDVDLEEKSVFKVKAGEVFKEKE